MSALELKDITNLPTSLPYSVIPQPQSEGGGYKHGVTMGSHGLQQQLALQSSGKHMDVSHQQRRMMSFNDSGCCELMDDSLTDMQWLQRMDAGTINENQPLKPYEVCTFCLKLFKKCIFYALLCCTRVRFSRVDTCSAAEEACK